MEKGICVRDIEPNMEISGIFIIANSAQLQGRNGPYWRMSLMDATGSVDGKLWPPKSLDYHELPDGRPVYANGRSVLFREQLQISVEHLRYLEENEIAETDISNFMPVSARNPDEMMVELKELCREEFRHPPWRRLFNGVMNDPALEKAFRQSPAARNIHHAWIGGLLEHTLGVARLCLKLADLYPEIDRQTLLAGAIFHDLGKIREFSQGFSIDYTSEGNLEGHAWLGLEILLPHIEKSGLEPCLADHLKHLILSHHGQPEFGATKLPQTREAFMLHFADNIDARMNQCNAIFKNENIAPGQWSSWQKSLERKLYNATPTPNAKIRTESEKDPAEQLCLLALRG